MGRMAMGCMAMGCVMGLECAVALGLEWGTRIVQGVKERNNSRGIP